MDLVKRCTFDDIIEALKSGDNKTYCSQVDLLNHWMMDHRWYLRYVDDQFIDSNIFPVRQTNMVEDFENFCDFGIGIGRGDFRCKKTVDMLRQTHENISPKDVETLSPATESFLKEYLKDEIALYNRLLQKVASKSEEYNFLNK